MYNLTINGRQMLIDPRRRLRALLEDQEFPLAHERTTLPRLPLALVLDSNVRVDTSFWKCWEDRRYRDRAIRCYLLKLLIFKLLTSMRQLERSVLTN